jgi:2-iminobutanoate/2-iminopropanoate deaminase
MTMRPVNAENAPQTSARHYSQAMEVSGASRFLFIGGQIPADVVGNVPDDFESQARLCWKNLKAQLAAADMTFANLVKVTVFLKRYEDRDINAKVRFEVFGDHRPALSTIIADVYETHWLLEIEAIAAA